MSGNFDGYAVGLPAQDNILPNQENAEFNALLEKSQQSKLESKLQPARVGGYSKKSVEDFVTEMRHSLLQVKTQLERQILDLAAEKASVAQECTVLRTQLKTAVETLATRNQSDNPAYHADQYAFEQESEQDGMENERLKSLIRDNQSLLDEKKKYEELLEQKEFEIAQLNETLVKYGDDCNALKEKTEQLENMLNNSTDSELELGELRRQKDEIEEKYLELLLSMEETNLELEQKKQHLDDTEIQLEQKKQHLDEMQMQLEQEKAALNDTEIQLEQKKQHLDKIQMQLEQEKAVLNDTEIQLEQKKQHLDDTEIQLEQKKQRLDDTEMQLEQKKQRLDEMQLQLEQEKLYLLEAQAELEQKQQHLDEIKLQLEQEKAHLEDTRVQLELKNKQLAEVQAKLDSEIQAREFMGHMMTKDYENADGSQASEYLQSEGSGEKLFESLYVHYSHLKGKVEHQESIIAEKEILLEQYKELENETAALRQEHENAKEVIASLKSSFEQVLQEMDEQTDTLNLYISRSRKDRETLKTALNDRSSAQPKDTELLNEHILLEAKMEELEEESIQLEEAVLKPYSQILRFDNAKRIIPLNENGKGHISDETDECENNSMNDLTKAADI